MSKAPRRKFSPDDKREILDLYISGKKSVSELAHEHKISTGLIYQWKSDQNLKDRNSRVEELTEAGATRAMALKIQQQEAEIEAYQKKVAELTVINDLLKKLRAQTSSPFESELTGLIGTIKKSAQKRKLVKL